MMVHECMQPHKHTCMHETLLMSVIHIQVFAEKQPSLRLYEFLARNIYMLGIIIVFYVSFMVFIMPLLRRYCIYVVVVRILFCQINILFYVFVIKHHFFSH